MGVTNLMKPYLVRVTVVHMGEVTKEGWCKTGYLILSKTSYLIL